VMSSEGRFVEVQGTGEHGTFDRAELDRLLELAVKGLRELDTAQRRALELDAIGTGTGTGSGTA